MYGSYELPGAGAGSQWKSLFDTIKNNERPTLFYHFQPGIIEPGMLAPVYSATAGSIGASLMYWGFPRWEGECPISIARADRAPLQSLFRKALLERRVAVPAEGIYEWLHGDPSHQDRYYFFSPQNEVLYLAGFYTVFKEEDGDRPCFCLLTTNANESVSPFHNRMPVLLREEERDAWIMGKNIDKILCRIPFALQSEPTQVVAMLM